MRVRGAPIADECAIDETASSSVFHASQAGHCPCHCGVRAPQLPQT
jgi:hypothetical protein